MSVIAWNQYSKCIDQCVHFEITDDLLHQAIEDEKNMLAQKGIVNRTTVDMNRHRDKIGSLAQNGLFEKVKELGVKLDSTTPYFDATIHSDLADFWHRGGSNDIRGSVMGREFSIVYPNSRLLVYDNDREKDIDWYTFVKIDENCLKGHIVGVIRYDKVWTDDHIYRSPKLKAPCHYVYARETKPFRDYLFGI